VFVELGSGMAKLCKPPKQLMFNGPGNLLTSSSVAVAHREEVLVSTTVETRYHYKAVLVDLLLVVGGTTCESPA